MRMFRSGGHCLFDRSAHTKQEHYADSVRKVYLSITPSNDTRNLARQNLFEFVDYVSMQNYDGGAADMLYKELSPDISNLIPALVVLDTTTGPTQVNTGSVNLNG